MAAPTMLEAHRWTEFSRTFCIGAAAVLGLYLALAYAIDPYDSGRSTLLSVGAVRPQGQRTAAAVRARDPSYQGAIFGNSHIQLIEPSRLSQATGIPFVQLSVTATSPAEQFALLGWYLRHHPAPQAIVVAADAYWCTDDPRLSNPMPFPFWLFSDSLPEYLRGLMRWSVFEEFGDRVRWLASKQRAEAPRDGWWDYENDYLAQGYGRDGGDSHRAAEREAPAPDTPEPGRAGPDFPAAVRFGKIVAALPEKTALVLVFPPVYAPALPRPGTPHASADAACKAAMAGALRGHPDSAVVDWRRDRPELHDPGNFFDQSHYRHPLAQRVAEEIAETVRTLRARTADGPAPRP